MTEYDSSLLAYCQKLIAIDGVSGSEGEVALCLEEEMLHLGFDTVEKDRYGNVIGIVYGNDPGVLMFEGHMDTVGIGDRALWTYDPYGSDFVDGKLYGRGTSDMRCALAAMVHAVGSLTKEKTRDHVTLCVVGVVYEEIFEGIGFGKILDHYIADAVVLGEASQLHLMLGQKGRCELSVETFGTNAHSAHPEMGKNAIEAMGKVLHHLPRIERPTCPLLGEGIMVVTDIISRPYPGSSVIPDHCQITIDRRTLIGESPTSVVAEMEKELAFVFAPCSNNTDLQTMAKASPKEFAISIPTVTAPCYTTEKIGGKRFFPAWIIEEDTALVRYAGEAIKQVGLPLVSGYYPFCTDGSESSGNRGIPTIGFGPSCPSLAHIVDEYVHFNQVVLARDVYKKLAKGFRVE